MDRNPYVRPELTATRDRVPDPAIELEGPLDRLEELLALAGPEPDALECYDLLALWARLQRVPAEWPERLGSGGAAAALDRVIAGQGPALARQALTVPNVPAWLEETRALEEAYEEAGDPVARSTLAERLLTDLDDAELVAYAARRLGVTDTSLEQELDRCRAWVAAHADLFLAAGLHVQAVGMTFRPDLAERDYDLALTALKYEQVLDAAVAAEAELRLEGVAPLPRPSVAAAARRFREEQALQQAAATVVLLAFARSLLRPRKAGRAGDPAPPPALLKWVSPDGKQAFLRLPEEGETTLTLRCYDAGGAAAALPPPVWLAGVQGEVTAAGVAFSLEAVQQLGQDLRLEVGPERVNWRPVQS